MRILKHYTNQQKKGAIMENKNVSKKTPRRICAFQLGDEIPSTAFYMTSILIDPEKKTVIHYFILEEEINE